MLPPCFHLEGLGEKGRKKSEAGTICQKFHTGFNLRLPCVLSGADGREDFLVYAGSLSRPLCCFGIAIEPKDMEDMLEACEEGGIAVLRKEGLLLYGRGEQFLLDVGNEKSFVRKDLSIPMEQEPKADSSLPGSLERLTGVSEKEEVRRFFRKEQEKGIWEDRMGIPWDGEFRKYAAFLAGQKVLSLERGRTDWWKEPADYLAGRGKGLTPGGDDILLGYGAVLMAAGSSEGFCLSQYMADMLGSRTTVVSQAYFKALASGYVNEDFRRLLLYLSGREKGDMEKAVTQIKALGHTSGHDTLFGAWMALEWLAKML